MGSSGVMIVSSMHADGMPDIWTEVQVKSVPNSLVSLSMFWFHLQKILPAYSSNFLNLYKEVM